MSLAVVIISGHLKLNLMFGCWLQSAVTGNILYCDTLLEQFISTQMSVLVLFYDIVICVTICAVFVICFMNQVVYCKAIKSVFARISISSCWGTRHCYFLLCWVIRNRDRKRNSELTVRVAVLKFAASADYGWCTCPILLYIEGWVVLGTWLHTKLTRPSTNIARCLPSLLISQCRYWYEIIRMILLSDFHCFESVLWVSFNALTLLVRWLEKHWASIHSV